MQLAFKMGAVRGVFAGFAGQNVIVLSLNCDG